MYLPKYVARSSSARILFVAATFLCFAILGLRLGAMNRHILQVLEAHQSNSEDYLGNWVNPDPNARGITKLAISGVDGKSLTVRIWVACNHQNCDWGATDGTIFAGKVQTNLDQGFVARKMSIVRHGDVLIVKTDSVYQDSRGTFQEEDHLLRQDRTITKSAEQGASK